VDAEFPECGAIVRALRCWLLPVLVLCTSGCSVQLAYNNLDRLARWSVSDYVTLDEPQRRYFDAAVHDLWVWHRRSHLPSYAQWLEELTLDQPLDEADMQRLVDQAVEWANDIAGRAVPIAAELLASLSDEQVARLARALAESNQKLADEELGITLAEAQRNWQKETGDRFSQFSGRLTGAQNAYLAEQSIRYIPQQVLWADYRRRWQADLLALLAYRHEAADFARAFEQLVANQSLYYGGELTAIVNSNRQLTREVSVWLISSMTDRQKQRFGDRLQGFADDFRTLAAARGRPPPSNPLLCLALCS
jgi:hypothetical protein